MKLSKGQGLSIFVAFLLFGIFNIVVFLAPLSHTIVFWLGYFFALFALATIALTLVLYFGKPVQEDKFLNLPAVKAAWTYFVLQTTLSVWEMVAFPLPYLPALIINLILGALFVIIILALYAASGKIDKSEQFTAEKVIFIKQLKSKLESIETDDAVLEKKIKELAEDVRFSDQMSHSKLAEIEKELDSAIDELVDNAAHSEAAMALCAKAAKLLKKRNDQCKMYKGVKDPGAAEAQKSGNGRGVAFAGVCVMLAMFLATLAVYFFIVPQTKYSDAIALLEAEKYDQATVAFADLGDYRDSKAKIEEIKIILLDKQYDAAEKLFNDGKYTEALEIYKALGGHRNSYSRMEEIQNRLSAGNVVYFGTYNGEPVAWRIVKTEEGRILLLADKIVKALPINTELKEISFKDSTLKAWLDNDFVKDFTEAQIEKIVTFNDMKVFIFDEKTVTDLKDAGVTMATDSEWWIDQESESGFKYVDKSGNIVEDGALVIRDKGVRPAIWISLE